MQQTDGVAVRATHLAHTDRRALSQAWYSALHLAERTPPAPRPAAARTAVALPGAARSSREPYAAAPPGPLNARRATQDARAPRAVRGGEIERRAPKADLARRIERHLRRPVARCAPTAFAVRGAGGRVQLIVRGDGARTRIVSVCAPPLRERVERALAHARFTLAARGLRAEVA